MPPVLRIESPISRTSASHTGSAPILGVDRTHQHDGQRR
jgi:hypothetical protein